MKRPSSKSLQHDKSKDKKPHLELTSQEPESIEKKATLSSHSSELEQSSRSLQSVPFKEGKGTGNQLFAYLYTPKKEGTKIHLFISGEAFAKKVAQDATVRLRDKSVVTIESMVNVTEAPTAGTYKNQSIIFHCLPVLVLYTKLYRKLKKRIKLMCQCSFTAKRVMSARSPVRYFICSTIAGTYLKLFDYTLYGYFTLFIGQQFFPAEHVKLQLVLSWGCFQFVGLFSSSSGKDCPETCC